MILFCTPCYGGMVTEPYLRSFLSTAEALQRANIDYDLLTLANESHVIRARNTCASEFIRGKWDYLMFLDSDMEWSADDFGKLFHLAQKDPKAGIYVGAYRMKKPGSPLAAWQNGKLVTDVNQLERRLDGIASVDYAGTGFMLIHREVFEKMDPPGYEEQGECMRWFHSDVIDDGNGPFYCSEDYWFCREARKSGFKILMDTSVKLTHWGTYGY